MSQDTMQTADPAALAKARAALAAARADVGVVPKNGTGQRGNRYCTADDVRDAILRVNTKHGLIDELTVHDPGHDDPNQFLATYRVTHIETGAPCIEMAATRLLHKGGAQDVAGFITYFVRYFGCAAYSIVGTEDDDGEGAQRAQRKQTRRPKNTPNDVRAALDDMLDGPKLDAKGKALLQTVLVRVRDEPDLNSPIKLKPLCDQLMLKAYDPRKMDADDLEALSRALDGDWREAMGDPFTPDPDIKNPAEALFEEAAAEYD